MNSRNILIRSSIVRNVEFFIQIVIALFMTPFIIHSLGDRMYGFWTLIGVFIGYYGLLDFGLSSAISRFVSQSIGRDDIKEINRIIGTAFFVYCFIAAISLLITVVIVVFSPNFIEDPSEVYLFRKIIMLLGTSISMGFPMKVYGGILTSYLRYDYISIVSIGRIVFTNFAIYFLLKNDFGLLALTVVNFATSIVQYVMNIIFCHFSYPNLRISFKNFDKLRVNSLFMYSAKTFIIQIADILRFRIDAFVVAAYVGISHVTYYSIGATLINYFGNLITSTIGMLSPVFSKQEGVGDFNAIRGTFLNVIRISVILSVFIGSSIIFYGKSFILRWMGPGFETSYYVAVILCIPAIFALMQTPGIGLMYGISKHHYYAISNTIEGILNVFLSIVLVKYYGIFGVALGTAIEMMLFKIFIQPIFICKAIKLSLYEYIVKTIFVTALKTLLPLVIFFAFASTYLRPNYFTICTIGIFQILTFVPVLLFYILNKEEKDVIYEYVGIARYYNSKY